MPKVNSQKKIPRRTKAGGKKVATKGNGSLNQTWREAYKDEPKALEALRKLFARPISQKTSSDPGLIGGRREPIIGFTL